jgi:hypothetical protein
VDTLKEKSMFPAVKSNQIYEHASRPEGRKTGIMMTVAWAPGKKKIYEFLLESLEELDLENSTEKASKLGESIDAEFVRIADEPDNSVRCGGAVGAGNAGTGFGAGGSGACLELAAGNKSGGAGSPGTIIITEYA